MNWNPEIAYWVINGLMFTIPFSWYVVLIMHKDLKKKNHIIKVQESFIDKLTSEEPEIPEGKVRCNSCFKVVDKDYCSYLNCRLNANQEL